MPVYLGGERIPLLLRQQIKMQQRYSQAVPPGRRYSALVLRSGFTARWNLAAPLGQSVPQLIGLSGLPSMLMSLPSCPPHQHATAYGTVGTNARDFLHTSGLEALQAGLGGTYIHERHHTPTAKPLVESLRKLRRLRCGGATIQNLLSYRGGHYPQATERGCRL
jgi:hypothetical protein